MSRAGRLALALAALAVAACGPSAGGADDAPIDAGLEPDGDACPEVATCGVALAFDGPATTVEVRGDFAEDGWEVGIPMTPDGDRFVATIPARPDGRSFRYAFLVDGTTLVPDPSNPRAVPDGSGGTVSVAYASCDDCPRPAFDWRDAVVYFILVDRFRNGDPTNDAPVDGVPAASNWAGGDLRGVLDAIEEGYFDDLGVNALWLTAPFAVAAGAEAGEDGELYTAYHGYWPTDPDAIDPRVGDRALLEAVVDAAHARGLRVILDYVMNHVHASSPVYAAHPEWFWPLEDCGVCGDGCSWDEPPEAQMCWFKDYLPDFDFQVDDARYASVSNAVRWARDLGLDGYRLDAVKHVEVSWVEDLRARLAVEVSAEGRPFYLIGETFSGDRELLARWVAPATRLDGQFDFPLRAALVRALFTRADGMADLLGFLDGNDGFYGEGAVMGTFLGNHDLPRVVHLAEDPPAFEEWDGGRERAWDDRPELPTDPAVFERLAMAYTVLLTLPGAPVLYYGDEVALPGGGDPDNRRVMPDDAALSASQLALRDHIARLARLRAAEPALRRGRRVSRGGTADVGVYARVEGTQRLFVVVNRGDESAASTGLPAGEYDDVLGDQHRSAPFDVPPRSALVLRPTE